MVGKGIDQLTKAAEEEINRLFSSSTSPLEALFFSWSPTSIPKGLRFKTHSGCFSFLLSFTKVFGFKTHGCCFIDALREWFTFFACPKKVTKKRPRQGITSPLPVGSLIRLLCYCEFSIYNSFRFALYQILIRVW